MKEKNAIILTAKFSTNYMFQLLVVYSPPCLFFHYSHLIIIFSKTVDRFHQLNPNGRSAIFCQRM